MTDPVTVIAASGHDTLHTDAALRFLTLSARLLLEYNARTELIRENLTRVARHLDVDVRARIAYREVTLIAASGRSVHAQVPELRINAAVTVAVLRTLDELCSGRLALDAAIVRLENVERTAPKYDRWLLATMFGMAASALAWLLGADSGARLVAGVASAAGLIARQELARRHVVLPAQPFTAALIGAAAGGLAIRLGWTRTSELCVIVPALMLVPGPHLINSVDDMVENHLEMGVARLTLAINWLLAAALGVVAGYWLVRGLDAAPASAAGGTQISLLLDIALAGLAASGFGAVYNAPWRVLWVSILCGMVGHGIRYVGLDAGLGIAIATLLGCIPIGVIGSIAADHLRLPFSAVAFAGAVTMMPGLFIYQSIAGAMRLASTSTAADSALAATTLALSFKAAFVVGSLAVGLLMGAAAVRLMSRAIRATDTA